MTIVDNTATGTTTPTGTKLDTFYNSIFYAKLYDDLITISTKGGLIDQYKILNLILDELVKILPPPPPAATNDDRNLPILKLATLLETLKVQQDTIIAAIQNNQDAIQAAESKLTLLQQKNLTITTTVLKLELQKLQETIISLKNNKEEIAALLKANEDEIAALLKEKKPVGTLTPFQSIRNLPFINELVSLQPSGPLIADLITSGLDALFKNN